MGLTVRNRKKSNNQQMIPGVNTPLSKAADEYLDAISAVDAAQDNLEKVRSHLMAVMRRMNKDSFTHGDKKIIIRAGRKIESTIVLRDTK